MYKRQELRQAVLNGDFDVNEFLSQYKAAQAEKDEAEAKALRRQADFDNYRRRSRADVEAAIHRAAADLIGSILPVVDNFDRAWQAMTEGPEKEGDVYKRQAQGQGGHIQQKHILDFLIQDAALDGRTQRHACLLSTSRCV